MHQLSKTGLLLSLKSKLKHWEIKLEEKKYFEGGTQVICRDQNIIDMRVSSFDLTTLQHPKTTQHICMAITHNS